MVVPEATQDEIAAIAATLATLAMSPTHETKPLPGSRWQRAHREPNLTIEELRSTK